MRFLIYIIQSSSGKRHELVTTEEKFEYMNIYTILFFSPLNLLKTNCGFFFPSVAPSSSVRREEMESLFFFLDVFLDACA